jgi:hypothetical protein
MTSLWHEFKTHHTSDYWINGDGGGRLLAYVDAAEVACRGDAGATGVAALSILISLLLALLALFRLWTLFFTQDKGYVARG